MASLDKRGNGYYRIRCYENGLYMQYEACTCILHNNVVLSHVTIGTYND